MNNKLFTLIEIGVIAGLILFVLYLGGVFKTQPAPTPTSTGTACCPPTPTSTQPPSPTQRSTVALTSTSNPTLTPTYASTVSPISLTQPSGLIAFNSNRDGNAEIYVMTAGGRDVRNLT